MDRKQRAIENIKAAPKPFLRAVVLLLAESLVVQAVWNRVLVDIAPVETAKYWQILLVVIAARLALRNIKINLK